MKLLNSPAGALSGRFIRYLFYCFLNCIFLFCLRLRILAFQSFCGCFLYHSFLSRFILHFFFRSLARCCFLRRTLHKTYPYWSYHNCTSMYPQHCNRILPLLALLVYLIGFLNPFVKFFAYSSSEQKQSFFSN